MTEQWKELKETITELRDNDGTGTQQEVCKFLVNHMNVLEKQMQEPCEDAISREAVLNNLRAELHATAELHDDGDYYLRDEWIDEYFDEYKAKVEPQAEPCGDAISRTELLKAIDTWDKFGCDADTKLVPYKDHYIPYIHYDDVVKCIKGMPSVKPQEPKTGHWVKTPKAVMGEGYMWYCDKCGHQVYQDSSRDYPSEKYCPNCGARMVETQESEDENDGR